MFKLKASVLLFLVILLNALAIHYAIDSQREKAQARSSNDLKGARLKMQRDLRLHELELRNVAAVLARGEISAFMEALDRFRDPLYQLRREVYEAVPTTREEIETQVFDEELMKQRRAFAVGQVDLLTDFTRVLADNYERAKGDAAWPSERPRSLFMAEYRRKMAQCVAGAAGDCAFELTHPPLVRDTARVRRDWADRVRVDLVLVTDRSGTGRANADDATWSDRRDFGDRYPVARAALQGRVFRDLLRFGETSPAYYVAVAAPIRHQETGRTLGALIVGTELDLQHARNAAAALGVDVTFLHHGEVIASTLPKDAYDAIASATTGGVGNGDGRFQVVTLPYGGNFTDNKKVTVVLSTDLALELAGFESLAFRVILLAVLILVVALVILHLLIRGFAQQFERIDAGIHEVISGNEDYQFSFDLPDRLASDMAQSLNLMVAVLLGRPLPEESAEGRWDEALLIDGHAEETDSEGEESDEAPVGPALEPIGGERGEELLSEPAEAYYRRLFAEYVDARKATGDDVGQITYVKFVEKLVRNERRLKERLGCRYVRFEVGLRDGQVVLTPIPIG